MLPRRGSGVLLVACLLAVGGCTAGGKDPLATSTPTSVDTAPTTANPTASASPGTTSGTETTSATPGGGPSGTESPSGSPSPSATEVNATCSTVDPIRVARVDTSPRRTTEVVTIVSDGRNLTPGTREQSDFLTPTLSGPDGTTITDASTINKVAALMIRQRHRVLVTRPDAPDAAASASRRPFSAPGTYVLYNASSQLVADVVVGCSGQEQSWDFVSEADPSTGQLNCAVEPSRSNALARLVYQGNCQ